MPKDRKDKGKIRSVDFDAANELVRRKQEKPDVPLTTLVKMMSEEDSSISLKLHSAYRLIISV